MKQLFTLFFILPAFGSFAQTLTNDGATITVQSGTTFYIAGGLLNKAGSTLTNAGTVQTTGDLTNQGALNSAGTLLFSGSTNQAFTPGSSSTVNNLTLNNSGAVSQRTLTVSGDVTVSTALTLTNGLVRTAPAATISLADGATLTGETTGRYVQGNLQAVRNAVSGSSTISFPNGASINPGGQNLGTVTITRTAGLQTAGVSFGQNMGGTQHGIDRVWTVAATGTQPSPANPAALTVTWLSDDDNDFATSTNAQLWRAADASGLWGKMGLAASAASRSFTANINQTGIFTVSNITAPLPVELTRFAAEPQGGDALLKWSTASEKNNDHFDVEASADGREFRRIGTVAGHGTTTQAQDYQLVDKNIARYAADLVYYRLLQVDTDGQEVVSPVRTVQVKALAGLTAAAWPTPFAGTGLTLNIRAAAAGPAMLLLHDAVGRTLRSQQLDLPAGSTTLALPELARLATGVYIFTLTQDDKNTRVKVVHE